LFEDHELDQVTQHLRILVSKYGYEDSIDMIVTWVHPCNLVNFVGSSLYLSGDLTVSPNGAPATATLGNIVYSTPESFSSTYNCGSYTV
jgi:hypothetical protein